MNQSASVPLQLGTATSVLVRCPSCFFLRLASRSTALRAASRPGEQRKAIEAIGAALAQAVERKDHNE